MVFHSWAGLARVPTVGVLACAALVLFIRISGKRRLAKLDAFGLVVTVALGSTLPSVLLNDSIALSGAWRRRSRRCRGATGASSTPR